MSETVAVPTDTPPAENTTIEPVKPTGEEAVLVDVVDGDTIVVLVGGIEERIRYIGIDTPEFGMCFGGEATAANAALIEGKTVFLERDPDGERDSFGRLLRYVRVGDVFVNERLVRDGFAEATTRFPERTYRDRLVAAEREAVAAGRGIWTACPGFGEPS